jgi:hypothetical protein
MVVIATVAWMVKTLLPRPKFSPEHHDHHSQDSTTRLRADRVAPQEEEEEEVAY